MKFLTPSLIIVIYNGYIIDLVSFYDEVSETMYSIDVSSVIRKSHPEQLKYPILSLGHCEHVVDLALMGWPQLAADHLLVAITPGKLVDVLGNIIRQLNLEFVRSKPFPDKDAEKETRKICLCQRAYEVLIEIALNLCGMESRRAGFSESEANEALKYIIYTMNQWESREKHEAAGITVTKAVVDKFLLDMRKVMHGEGMVAMMAEGIEKELVEGRLASSFVMASKKTIQSNVYFQMTAKGMCKFGNDYALGLRWLRHLGYVQVSTNPVLAARAYNDNPELWDEFREVARKHKEWFGDPDKYGDEIAMQATMIALWPNLVVFRPIAILSNFHDGMVSYQLNPNVAASLDGSVEDALKIYSSAEEFLQVYDAYLTWCSCSVDHAGRPNMVFKVAAGYPAAVDITVALNSMGIGTNNTVTYTVAQEAVLILAAMKGMSKAVKKGIHPTQVYETNMGGRLESHLRELEAEKQLLEALSIIEDKEELLGKLAEGLGALAELGKNVLWEEKIRAICGYRYLKKLTHPAFVEAMASAEGRGKKKDEIITSLTRFENDIGLVGTFVAHRVYWLFFSLQNRPKWLKYLQEEFGLSHAEAEEIVDKVDVLPASKRKPADTFLTLAERNMTNTEFPNHQWGVAQASRQQEFNLSEYSNAIARKPNPDILQRILNQEDFRKAYELTPELMEALKRVGIKGEFGIGGLKVEDWSCFGSVVKTMNEFGNAYETFKKSAIDVVRKLSEHKR